VTEFLEWTIGKVDLLARSLRKPRGITRKLAARELSNAAKSLRRIQGRDKSYVEDLLQQLKEAKQEITELHQECSHLRRCSAAAVDRLDCLKVAVADLEPLIRAPQSLNAEEAS